MSLSHSAGSEMSAATACASPPAARMAATVVSSEPSKRVLALAQRARRADDAPAFGGEQPRDLGADAAARARHDHDLAVQLSHGFSWVCR